MVPTGWSEDATIDAKAAECTHIAAALEPSGGVRPPAQQLRLSRLAYSRLVATPMVTTIHGSSSERILGVYERYDDRCAYVAISDSDRRASLTYAATIHHGIDVGALRSRSGPG